MYIDLDDEVTRFLVQEYVNKICNFVTEKELNSNVHKLVHTFAVADTAVQLTKLTEPTLPEEIQKQVLNAAILHDVGRCYEFENGIPLEHVDHGKIGAQLIQKRFPEMEVEIQSTFYHNKLSSPEEPQNCHPVLDYVRDADMLANIQYEINHPEVWIHHFYGANPQGISFPDIDEEIFLAVREKRPARSAKIKRWSLLMEWLWQSCWCFNVTTDAGKKFACQTHLFERFRDMICEKIVPMLALDQNEQKKLSQTILDTFSDELFSSVLTILPTKKE